MPSQQQTPTCSTTTFRPNAVIGDPRDEVTDYIRTKQFTPNTMLALRELVNGIGTEMALYKELKAVPQDKVRNFRNDMYVVSEALRLMKKSGKPAFSTADAASPRELQEAHRQCHQVHSHLGKVAVALALGLGTMIGWKRIVVTVGEKIGKDHLTYGRARPPKSRRWPPSARPTGSAYPSVPRTCFPPA